MGFALSYDGKLRLRPRYLLGLSLLGVSCTESPSLPTQGAMVPTIVAARPTGDVNVSAADPDSAAQGTTLDVTITGSGFTDGSVAEWALKGVKDPNQVRTNSTRYVSSRELIANVTVSGTATVASWDIIVMAGPKTGIGTEMFAVKSNANTDTDSRVLISWDSEVNVAAPGAATAMAPAGVQGDSRGTDGLASSNSDYQGSICGVRGKVFWDDANGSGSGDLVFDPDMDYSRGMSSACGSSRTLRFYLGYQEGGSTGTATPIGTWTNAIQAIQLNVGDSRSQRLRFWYVGLRNCDRIDFDVIFGSGTANVRITRSADVSSANGKPLRRWRVESEYPHRGMCTIMRGGQAIAKGTRYLPFGFTATEVPYPYPTGP